MYQNLQIRPFANLTGNIVRQDIQWTMIKSAKCNFLGALEGRGSTTCWSLLNHPCNYPMTKCPSWIWPQNAWRHKWYTSKLTGGSSTATRHESILVDDIKMMVCEIKSRGRNTEAVLSLPLNCNERLLNRHLCAKVLYYIYLTKYQ